MKILTEKKQHEICAHILANAIIAFDLLDFETMGVEKIAHATETIVSNTLDAVYKVGGETEMLAASMIIKKYKKKV